MEAVVTVCLLYGLSSETITNVHVAGEDEKSVSVRLIYS